MIKHTELTPPQRNSTIDCMKGYGICLMVLGHSGSPYRNWIYLFHMALFFMASGYMWNDTHASTVKSIGQYIKKKMKGLYVPYVMINLFFTLTFDWFYQMGIYSSSNMDGIVPVYPLDKSGFIRQILKVFLFSGGSQLAGATWFLRSLFFITISNAIIAFAFNKLGIGKFYNYSMLIISGVGAIMANHNYLHIGDALGKFGLRSYFAGYFAYMLGVLVKKLGVMEQTKGKNKSVIITSFLVLCIMNCIGRIELNIGQIENIVFYAIASLTGWSLVYALSDISLKVNRILSYIGRKSIWILGLHVLSFKMISFTWIKVNHMNEIYLAKYPVIDQPGFLWIAYLVAGILVPLFIELLYGKLHRFVSVWSGKNIQDS